MTLYVDFDFYEAEYEGKIVEADNFGFYSRKASQIIKQYTCGNVPDEVPESVKFCCCELSELLYKSDKSSSSQGVTSEKVGDWSASYESGESQQKALSSKIRSVVYSWLADTGLLYRGVKIC